MTAMKKCKWNVNIWWLCSTCLILVHSNHDSAYNLKSRKLATLIARTSDFCWGLKHLEIGKIPTPPGHIHSEITIQLPQDVTNEVRTEEGRSTELRMPPDSLRHSLRSLWHSLRLITELSYKIICYHMLLLSTPFMERFSTGQCLDSVPFSVEMSYPFDSNDGMFLLVTRLWAKWFFTVAFVAFSCLKGSKAPNCNGAEWRKWSGFPLLNRTPCVPRESDTCDMKNSRIFQHLWENRET